MIWKILLALPVIWAFTAPALYDTAYGKSHGYCNKTLSGKTGSFYPNNATNHTSFHCEYNITDAKVKGPVCLFFMSLFLDENDEVNIYGNPEDVMKGNNLTMPIKAQNGTLTVVTGLESVIVVFSGPKSDYIRNFETFFTRDKCIIPVGPDVEIIHSPIYVRNATRSQVEYHFNDIQHKRVMQAFTFMNFDMKGSSSVKIEGGTHSATYSNNPPEDFFSNPDHGEVLKIEVDMDDSATSSDHFLLKIIEVDKNCSGYHELSADKPYALLHSPPEVLNNGTILNECRWIVKHKDSNKILGLSFDKLDFRSVFDIVAVNDGLSETSSALLQLTTSNRNVSKTQFLRSGAGRPYLWISFKPLHYSSFFAANVTVHGQGGYMKNEGILKMIPTVGDDTVFLLEVEADQVVMLTFDESSFRAPATLSLYDGFETTNLLTALQGQVKYPLLSKGPKMMIIASKFSDSSSHFSAKFKGVSPSCNQMSTLSKGNYILSETCNSTCTWVIPPQNVPNSELIIYLQYRSLNEGDTLEINQLDSNLTQLGLLTSKTGHVAPIAVPANVGAMVKVTQGACKAKTDKIVLVGHSSVLPGRNFDMAPKPGEVLHISSPLYPDNYPVFSSSQWNITIPKNTFLHLAFDCLKLAPNHCVRISGNEKHEFAGDVLPDDIFTTGNTVVQFDSSKFDKKTGNLSLTADTGFQLNLTVAECGGILNKKGGEFETNMTGQNSICIWKIDVEEKGKINIISYTLSRKDKLENQKFNIYDGTSVRDLQIMNETNSDIWSRKGILIIKYERLNVSAPSSVYKFTYTTITCNSSMKCDNGMCLHPDWRCNGVNDCGDFTDERDCATVPIINNIVEEGYSSLSFWLCIFFMMFLGIILGVLCPVFYQKYRDSRYTRFRELSGIDA